MRYVLRKWVFGQVPQIEIDSTAYGEFKAARAVLTSGFAIEENYEILISNYQELETTILAGAAFDMVRDQIGYGDFFDTHLTLNRRLINLLTSARLYLDQWKQHVRVCTPDDKVAAEIKRLISEQYDTYREYRFMEELRNYAQHCGIPIHWLSHASNWTRDDDGEKAQMQFSIELVAEAKSLAKDDKFKAKILEELDERTDLTLYVRRYVECLSTIQDAVRQVTKEPIDKARALMESAHKRYLDAGADSVIGLDASILEDDRDVVIESTALLLDWDNVRMDLQKRNRRLVNLHRRHVTGESTFARKDAQKRRQT